MPGKTSLRALLALLSATVALSGCGSDEISGEIPPANAAELTAALEAVRDEVESGSPDCEVAASEADQFVAEVNALPADAGAELKTALREAGDHLGELVDQQCASTGTTDTTTSTTTPPPTTATTSSTTDSTSSTTTTDTTSTTTDEQPPPGNGNGNGPPGGVPPGQDGGTGGTGGGSGDESGD